MREALGTASLSRLALRACLFRDHPRLRGEHVLRFDSHEGTRGSPPPARGAPHLRVDLQPVPGITPACAGSTW